MDPVAEWSNVQTVSFGLKGNAFVLKKDGTVMVSYNEAELANPAPLEVTEVDGVTALFGHFAVGPAPEKALWWLYSDQGDPAGAVKVAGIAGVAMVHPNSQYGIAVKEDGTLWELSKYAEAPKQVPGWSNIAAVGGGEGSPIVLKDDGSLFWVYLWDPAKPGKEIRIPR